jgi:tetratricopeptide (TPR) repeat protein
MGDDSEMERPKDDRSGARRVRLPPAPPSWRSEADVLKDLGDAVGLVLWRVLRDLWLWDSTPAHRRDGIFPPSTEEVRERRSYARAQEPELTDSLGIFASFSHAPELITPQELGDACTRVYRWADARNHTETAICFAEAAARIEPENPARANTAARVCRRAALEDRAAVWYLRGFRLAVHGRQRAELVASLLGYGGLMYGLGRHRDAERYLHRAIRNALRTGRQKLAAAAHHDLMLLHAELGEFRESDAHAHESVALYPHSNPRIPHFVHDFAFTLARRSFFNLAIPLIEQVLPLVRRPEFQVLFSGTLALCVAAVGEVARYQQLESRILSMAYDFDEFAAAAFIGLADGARRLGRVERARLYVSQAIGIASRRHDGEPERVARRLLADIDADHQPDGNRPADPEVESLTRAVEEKLRRWLIPSR